MFNKKENVEVVSQGKQGKFDTLVGEFTSIEGLFKAEGSVRIDGKIKGEIAVQGDLFLGEKGSITGDIKATNLIVSGKIEGNIVSTDQLRITDTGKILGDVTVKSFIIDENAFFEGKCIMSHDKDTRQVEIQADKKQKA